MSLAGVILPPDGYLKQCYEAVRNAGGVCVADEVQVGFGKTIEIIITNFILANIKFELKVVKHYSIYFSGRFGKHFWAFEHQGVQPDIVTCGKPFGNGMPLSAVLHQKQI